MKKYRLTVLGCLLSIYCAFSQQMSAFNLSNAQSGLSNPAFTEIDRVIYDLPDAINSITASYRKQWTGVQNAPATAAISYDRLFQKARMQAGITLLTDKTGPTSASRVQFRYAYQIAFNDQTALSLGLGAGGDQFHYNGDANLLRDAGDVIGLESRTRTIADFCVGAFYTTELYNNDLFYAGISALQIGSAKLNSKQQNDAYRVYRKQHFSAKAGYVKLLENIGSNDAISFFEPSIEFRYAVNAPVQTTATVHIQLVGVVWMGMAYSGSFGNGPFRHDNLHFEAGVIFGGQEPAQEHKFKLCYGFDRSLTPYQIQLGSTHEVSLSYLF